MSVLFKKIFISSFLVCLLTPFILLTDLFPFLRFGMFAEPVRTEIQQEEFSVTYLNQQGKEVLFDPKSIGFDDSWFHYLSRNYYYRQEGKLFLLKLSKVPGIAKSSQWNLKHQNCSLNHACMTDSLIEVKIPL